MKKRMPVLLGLGLMLAQAHAAFVKTPTSPSAAGLQVGATYNQDFDSLDNYPHNGATGSSLPAGWVFGETGSGTTPNNYYRIDDGGTTTGDVYSLGVQGSTERAFGTLRTTSLVPLIGVLFRNDSSVPIASFTIQYTGEQWRLGNAGRSDRLDFEYRLGPGPLNSASWTGVDILDYVAPAGSGTVVGTTAPVSTSVVSGSLNLVSPLLPGETLWLRWSDPDVANSDDVLGIDNISITVVPEASTWIASVGALVIMLAGLRRKRLGPALML